MVQVSSLLLQQCEEPTQHTLTDRATGVQRSARTGTPLSVGSTPSNLTSISGFQRRTPPFILCQIYTLVKVKSDKVHLYSILNPYHGFSVPVSHTDSSLEIHIFILREKEKDSFVVCGFLSIFPSTKIRSNYQEK